MKYDVIGDIHGQAGKLEALLRRMGYQELAQGWVPPEGRQAIFLGDLIDRGPEQIKVVSIVRSMVEAGHARAIMGNHEFNAIGHMEPRRDAAGNAIPESFLSSRSDNKVKQHAEFLRQVGQGSALHLDMLEWFRSLPVMLDLGDIRVVHAWWHQPYVNLIASRWKQGEPLPDDLLHAAYNKLSDEYVAMEGLCKGLEIRLPDPHFYYDHSGVERRDVRVKWWHGAPERFVDVSIVDAAQRHRIPALPLPENHLCAPVDGSPIFVGHYWMEGEPHLMSPKVACVDWSAARGDEPLVAYRWHGESELDAGNFIASH